MVGKGDRNDRCDRGTYQGESKRRRELLEVPQAADSSSRSSSSSVKAQPTLNEIGLVDVCAILCDNSGVSKRDRFTEKPVAVAEEREGGPVTLDLTQWDFNKADCRTRCRKLIENSKPLLLMGSPIVSGGEDEEQIRAVLHLAFVHLLITRNTSARGTIFPSHTFAPQRAGTSQQWRISCTGSQVWFQTVTDRDLFRIKPDKMVDELPLHCAGTQHIE